MRRSNRESDDDLEAKSGRKARPQQTAHLVVDSPLRRSRRIKNPLKANDSSPESPVSDSSNISNAQVTRLTRKRAGTMESASDSQRALRSRKNSVSSDVSELAEVDYSQDTPSKRNTRKSLAPVTSSDTPKLNSRTSKRQTRAGSEAKSPPPMVRTTRRTRASSMEPESVAEIKAKEKNQVGSTGTPIKTRRRASILPSESTVQEEGEGHIPCIELNDTLLEVDESSVAEIQSESKDYPASQKTLGALKSKTQQDDTNASQPNLLEDSVPVNGPRDIIAKTPQADTHESINDSVSPNNMPNDKTIMGKNESKDESAVREGESMAISVEKSSIQSSVLDTSKELGLEIETLLNVSMKKQGNSPSNKENITSNIIGDVVLTKNMESMNSCMVVLSTKCPLPTKLLKDKYKSVVDDPVLGTDHSLESDNTEKNEQSSTDIIFNVTEDSNTLSKDIELSEKEKNSQDSQNTSQNTSQNIASDVELNTSDKSCNKDLSFKMDLTSDSVNSGTELSTENADCVKVTESNQTKESSTDPNDDLKMDVDISAADKEQDNENQNKHEGTESTNEARDETLDTVANGSPDVSMEKKADDTSTTVEAECIVSAVHEELQSNIVERSAAQENKKNTEQSTEILDSSKDFADNTPTNTTDKSLCPNAADVSMPEPIDDDSTAVVQKKGDEISTAIDNESSITLAREATDDSRATIEPKSTEAVLNLDDSVTARTEDQNDDAVKNSQSYIVTETADVPTEGMPNREEQSEELAALEISGAADRSLNKSANKSKRAAGGEKLEEENKDKGGRDKMDVDDSDSEANVGNLFQNISADEWKKGNARKKADSENGSVHSLSTEKLENESEAECDLVLVDRDAWLMAENARAAKDKDSFDYDSDDTVVLKSRADSMRHRGKKDSSMKEIDEEREMEVDEDDGVKPGNREKTPKGKNSKSEEDKLSKDDTEAIEDASNTSIDKSKDSAAVKEAKRVSLVDLNASQKSVSLNESQKVKEGQRRKSLNVSTADVDMENPDDSTDNLSKSKNGPSKIQNEANKSKTGSIDGEVQKRKSLNKSLNKSRSKNDEDSNELSETHPLSASCKKNVKNRTFDTSLNASRLKETPVKGTKVVSSSKKIQIKATSSEDSEAERETSKILKVGSGKKKRLDNNYSTLVHVGTDSEENIDSDSNDSHNKTLKIPKFLFASASSDDEENAAKFSEDSMDSDIAREYNLKGDTDAKFSDDNIPGDECRASESEVSDPDDNGSDLADFVVYDDEVEEEWSEENEEEGENDEDGEDNEDGEIDEDGEDNEEGEIDEDENEENEGIDLDENADESDKEERDTNEEDNAVEDDKSSAEEEMETSEVGKRKRNKEKSKQSIDCENTEGAKTKDKSKASNVESDEKANLNSSKKSKQRNLAEIEIAEQQLNMSDMMFIGKVKKLNASMECSTPKVAAFKRKVFEMSDTTPENTSIKSRNKSSKPLEENNVDESRRSSKGKSNEKSILGKSLPSDLKGLVESTNSSKPKNLRISDLNKTAVLTGGDTPRTKFLRKEKLSESAPALKLGKDSERLMKSFAQGKLSQSANAELMEENGGVVDSENTEESQSLERNSNKASKEILSDDENIQENVPRKVAKRSKKKHDASFEIITGQPEEPIETTSESDDKKKKKRKKKNATAKENSVSIDNTQKSLEVDKSTEDETSDSKKKKQKKKPNKVNETEQTEIRTKKRKVEDISAESMPKKRNKKAEVPAQKSKASKLRQVEELLSDSDEAPETLTFAKARDEALDAIKRVKESIRASKEAKNQKRVERLQKTREEERKPLKLEKKKRLEDKRVAPHVVRQSIKRLPEEVIENLSDVPIRKRQKRMPKQECEMPSRSARNTGFAESSVGNVDDSFISLSSSGGTTQFSVVKLQKLKKHTKKSAAVAFFRQRMLSRNGRQPVSAYLMYLQKQKASGRDKF